jgi:hypothetical protein
MDRNSQSQEPLTLQIPTGLGDIHRPNSMQNLHSKALHFQILRLASHLCLPSRRLGVALRTGVLRIDERAQSFDEFIGEHTYTRFEGAFPLPVVRGEFLALFRR